MPLQGYSSSLAAYMSFLASLCVPFISLVWASLLGIFEGPLAEASAFSGLDRIGAIVPDIGLKSTL